MVEMMIERIDGQENRFNDAKMLCHFWEKQRRSEEARS